MRYYDIDSLEVWMILDEMEELLEGDQLLIFRALREGVERHEIAYELGISMKQLRDRIYYLRNKLRREYSELDLPRISDLYDLL